MKCCPHSTNCARKGEVRCSFSKCWVIIETGRIQWVFMKEQCFGLWWMAQSSGCPIICYYMCLQDKLGQQNCSIKLTVQELMWNGGSRVPQTGEPFLQPVLDCWGSGTRRERTRLDCSSQHVAQSVLTADETKQPQLWEVLQAGQTASAKEQPAPPVLCQQMEAD